MYKEIIKVLNKINLRSKRQEESSEMEEIQPIKEVKKMVRNPLLIVEEIELRDICRNHIDTLEQWCRRLIDEKFRSDYGNDYYDFEFDSGEPLISKKIKRSLEMRIKKNQERYPRWIDAIMMENIEYFFCRDNLYGKYFKEIFEPFYSGNNEIRFVLQRLIAIRNKLAHNNMISLHEAEQSICYTNDLIDCVKNYYVVKGKNMKYNVPVFIRLKDSLGNDLLREHIEYYPWELYWSIIYHHSNNKQQVEFRSGDNYKVWVEVDGSFPENTYEITWQYKSGEKEMNGKGNVVEVVFDDKDVSYRPVIYFHLKTNNSWHRRARSNDDDEIVLNLDDILPPINTTY